MILDTDDVDISYIDIDTDLKIQIYLLQVVKNPD